MIRSVVRSVFAVWFLVIVSGCVHRGPFPPGRTGSPPAGLPGGLSAVPSPVKPPSTEGSLWKGESAYNMFFVDNKARNVNDIVTIRIVESSKASKKATTKLGRSSSLAAGASNLFGIETKLDARHARVTDSNKAGTSKAAAIDLSQILNASTQNDFNGSGVTTRSGQLTGHMTALVKKVLPNGNLEIEGRRVVSVNGEEQIMVLTGIIRPADIDSNNVVLSTYIADASISYYGMGVVADKQRPGWLSRVFDKAWPF